MWPPGLVTRESAQFWWQRQGAEGHCRRRQPPAHGLLEHDEVSHNHEGAGAGHHVIEASADEDVDWDT